MDAELARKAISLVDLTDLTDDCTPAAIESLCERATRYGTAAVCVWPDFVAQSSAALAGTGVRSARLTISARARTFSSPSPTSSSTS